MRRSVAVIVALTIVLMMASCGSEDTSSEPSAQPHASAHEISPELEEKVLADATEDLRVIAGVSTDTSGLPAALTGTALTETQQSIDSDLAAGKYKVRDYRNIEVRLQDFTAPFAQVSAEFDDSSYYVDAATGAALSEPVVEHKAFALALVEEDGRWKIQGIFSPAATSSAEQAE